MKGLNYVYPHRGTIRGGKAKAALFARVVEGKRYTTAQVAEILAISHSAAYERIKRRPHPLTWTDLQKARLP